MAEPVRPETRWEQNQPPTWQWLLIGGIALIALFGLTLFITLGYRSYSQWAADRKETATQELAAEATAAKVESATATAVGRERARTISRAKEWPLLIYEPFDNNVNDWLVGEIDDEYSKIRVSLEGVYTWEATAKQGFVWRVWPRSDEVDDFYLAVEVENRSRNEDAQYGLIFHNDENGYYYLEARDSGYFRLMVYDGQAWRDLIMSTYSEAFKQNEANKLAVISNDGVIYVLVNGRYAGETEDSPSSQGQAGIAIGLSNEGDGAIITFDNFELRAPGGLK